ncbi:hypothetical protein RugamoR57_55110 [Duganella caerulea]
MPGGAAATRAAGPRDAAPDGAATAAGAASSNEVPAIRIPAAGVAARQAAVRGSLPILISGGAACTPEASIGSSINSKAIKTHDHMRPRPGIAICISPPHSGLLYTVCKTTSVPGRAPNPITVTR